MTPAKYIIRFDDICATMNWPIWDQIETCLDQHSIKPILAVTPANQHDVLISGPPRSNFWDRCRGWQAKGYEIALHGYDHLFLTSEKGLYGFSGNSEFAGVPYDVQDAKISRGLGVFESEKISTRTWVAPNHSFDSQTLKILNGYGVDVVSDSLYSRSFRHRKYDCTIIPQQLWDFRPKKRGLWTITYHHNTWTKAKLEHFKQSAARGAGSWTSVTDVLSHPIPDGPTVSDSLHEYLYRLGQQKIRPILAKTLQSWQKRYNAGDTWKRS